MFHFTKKQLSHVVAAALALSTILSIGAAAYDSEPETYAATPVVLSANINAGVGTALTSDQVMTAEQVLEQARLEAEAKAKAEAEAKAKAEAAKNAYNNLLTAPISARTVAYSSSLLASDAVKANARSLGNYRLSFYCDCAVCNGRSDAKTALGTIMQEGRTIAVDSRIIPLGSRVYIDGYGVFIAEDTGGAIKGNRIDVMVSGHSHAYDLGIRYADVYVLR